MVLTISYMAHLEAALFLLLFHTVKGGVRTSLGEVTVAVGEINDRENYRLNHNHAIFMHAKLLKM